MAGSDYDMSLILGTQKNIKHKKTQILCFMFYVLCFMFMSISNFGIAPVAKGYRTTYYRRSIAFYGVSVAQHHHHRRGAGA